jgi:AcrR family transcriptional regulator
MASEVQKRPRFKRGPGGRPTQAEAERRHGALLGVARRLFLARGFDAVAIDEIAAETGVAKRFIYARYRDKAELFVAAIEHAMQDPLRTLRAFQPKSASAEKGLVELARMLTNETLRPEALALNRTFVAIAPRFPQLVRRFMAQNRDRSIGQIARVIGIYCDSGELHLDDPEMAAELFFMAVVGIPRRLALLGVREPASRANRRLRLAVHLFIEGCRARPRGRALRSKRKTPK